MFFRVLLCGGTTLSFFVPSRWHECAHGSTNACCFNRTKTSKRYIKLSLSHTFIYNILTFGALYIGIVVTLLSSTQHSDSNNRKVSMCLAKYSLFFVFGWARKQVDRRYYSEQVCVCLFDHGSNYYSTLFLVSQLASIKIAIQICIKQNTIIILNAAV